VSLTNEDLRRIDELARAAPPRGCAYPEQMMKSVGR